MPAAAGGAVDGSGSSGMQPAWQRWCSVCTTVRGSGALDAWVEDPSQRPAVSEGVCTEEGCAGCVRTTPPHNTQRKDGEGRKKRKRGTLKVYKGLQKKKAGSAVAGLNQSGKRGRGRPPKAKGQPARLAGGKRTKM